MLIKKVDLSMMIIPWLYAKQQLVMCGTELKKKKENKIESLTKVIQGSKETSIVFLLRLTSAVNRMITCSCLLDSGNNQASLKINNYIFNCYKGKLTPQEWEVRVPPCLVGVS